MRFWHTQFIVLKQQSLIVEAKDTPINGLYTHRILQLMHYILYNLNLPHFNCTFDIYIYIYIYAYIYILTFFSVITNFEVFRKPAQSDPCDEPVLLSPEITLNL